MKGEKYNEKADVYSYGVVLWELLTRKVPWQNLPMVDVVKTVVNGHRPPINQQLSQHSEAPEQFVSLMQQCWDSNPQNRPSFEDVLKSLQHIAKDWQSNTSLSVRRG